MFTIEPFVSLLSLQKCAELPDFFIRRKVLVNYRLSQHYEPNSDRIFVLLTTKERNL